VNRARSFSLWTPVVLHMALIFGLSSIAYPPDVSDAGIENLDKYVHVLLYGALSALFIRARSGGWSQSITLGAAISAVIFATAYGVTDEFHQLFVRRAEEVMSKLTVLYDTVPPMVEALREGGLKLAIVSTKYRRRISEVLRREALLHGFEVVIGGEDVEQHKPHPQGLFEAIEKLECSPESVVYVGDSVVDAELAKRAGVPLIVVLSGVTPRTQFDIYEPLAVLENVSHLPKIVLRKQKTV